MSLNATTLAVPKLTNDIRITLTNAASAVARMLFMRANDPPPGRLAQTQAFMVIRENVSAQFAIAEPGSLGLRHAH